MRLLSPVVWSEGMHLAPHHFQAQSRYFEDFHHFSLTALVPFAWGLAGLELDGEALRNGTVSILHARGIMPDGLPFHFPHDPAPDPIQIEGLFSPTAQSHRVLLSVPPYRPASANAATLENGRPANVRFLAAREPVLDHVTGQDEKPVPLARKNFRLVLDVEERHDEEAPPEEDEETGSGPDGSGPVTLPVARIRRDGAGNFVYDPDFVPPCLSIGASRGLVELLARLVEMLEDRSASLRAERAGGGQDHGPGEIVGFWFTHAVNAHLALLRHHLATRASHPERVFADLSTLAGALSTFSLTGDAARLPSYDHDAPEEGFRVLEREVRKHLGTVVPTHLIRMAVEPRDGYFHTARAEDRRAFEADAHWFLGVRTTKRRDEVIAKAPKLVKICSAKHIDRLVREAYPGLDIEHAPTPPSGLSPRPATEYFRVGRTEPCWRSIVETGDVGIYVPGAIPTPELELVAVLDEGKT